MLGVSPLQRGNEFELVATRKLAANDARLHGLVQDAVVGVGSGQERYGRIFENVNEIFCVAGDGKCTWGQLPHVE